MWMFGLLVYLNPHLCPNICISYYATSSQWVYLTENLSHMVQPSQSTSEREKICLGATFSALFTKASNIQNLCLLLGTSVTEQWWTMSSPLTTRSLSTFSAILRSNPGSRSGWGMTVTASPRPNRKPAYSNPSAVPPTTRVRAGGWGRERTSSLRG